MQRRRKAESRIKARALLSPKQRFLDCPTDQVSLSVEGGNGVVDGCVESGCLTESLVGKIVRLQVAPDSFDVIEFGRVFRKPFDGEPMDARRKCCQLCPADMDRAIIEDDDNGLGPQA